MWAKPGSPGDVSSMPTELTSLKTQPWLNSFPLLSQVLTLLPVLAGLASWTDCVSKSLQSCPPLCDPLDCSPPGSSVLGILQVRILELVAMHSSRGYSQLRDPSLLYLLHWQASSSPPAPPGKPHEQTTCPWKLVSGSASGNLKLRHREPTINPPRNMWPVRDIPACLPSRAPRKEGAGRPKQQRPTASPTVLITFLAPRVCSFPPNFQS